MQFSRTGIAAILSLALGATTLTQFADAADWGKVSDEEWATVAPADYPSANAVYLFANGEYTVRTIADGGAEFRHHYRVKVLTPAGVEEAGNIEFWYDEDNKIGNFEAHTIHPDGKKYKVDKKAVVERSVRGGKQRAIAFPAVVPGCILEYKYTVHSEYLGNLDTWYFQHRFYTLHSSLKLSHDEHFEYHFTGRNIASEKSKPVEERSLDARAVASGGAPSYLYHFTWEVEDLMPRMEEPYQSCLQDYRTSMRFHIANYSSKYSQYKYLESWPKIGADYTRWLVDEYNNRRGEIEALARTVTAGLTAPAEQSRALYRHVVGTYQTSENYCNKYQVNRKVSELLKTKAGSGEEKNLLLVALHRALGLESWPVMIGTRQHGRFDPRRPDLTQFNYVVAVAQIDSNWTFLDAASQYYPYGILTPDCLAEAGLLLDGDSSDIVSMSIRPARSMRIDTTRMFIGPDYSATCSTITVYSGYTASTYAERFDRRTPDEFAREFYLQKVGVPCDLAGHAFSRDTLDQFTAAVTFTSGNLVEDLDGNLIVKPVTFTFRTNPFTNDMRFTPIDFVHPFLYRNVAEVIPATPPAEYDLPPDTSFSINGATFSRRCSQTETGVVVETELTVTRPLYSPSDYATVREFFGQIARAIGEEVALVAQPR